MDLTIFVISVLWFIATTDWHDQHITVHSVDGPTVHSHHLIQLPVVGKLVLHGFKGWEGLIPHR